MICSLNKNPRQAAPAEVFPPLGSNGGATNGQHPYGTGFWFAYLANLLVMIATALLFRYADLVTVLGGTEFHLGWIVGVGTLGSLLTRLLLATGIDSRGPRLVWLGSVVFLAVVCFAHLGLTTCHGPAIYLLRIAMASAIAGVFGASMTFISGRAVVERMAEMMGMLGTAGFFGIMIGTQLGDVLLGTETIQRWQVERMFIVAGVLSGSATLFAWLATRGHVGYAPRRKRPPMAWLMRRYHPGPVLLVGVSMGVALGLPGTFLRPYAAELDILRIGLFFCIYSPVAILTRLLTRRLPERIGVEPMIVLGLVGMVVSQLLLLVVHSEWQFVFPGIGYGISHAVLFPSTIAAGSRGFPERYRGLGTMLMFATVDVGVLVGAPMSGAILHYSSLLGLPSYPAMFVSMAGLLGVVCLVYGLTLRRAPPRVKPRPPHRLRPSPEMTIATGQPAEVGAAAGSAPAMDVQP